MSESNEIEPIEMEEKDFFHEPVTCEVCNLFDVICKNEEEGEKACEKCKKKKVLTFVVLHDPVKGDVMERVTTLNI